MILLFYKQQFMDFFRKESLVENIIHTMLSKSEWNRIYLNCVFALSTILVSVVWVVLLPSSLVFIVGE